MLLFPAWPFRARDTPAPIVRQLSAAMSKALDLPSLNARFEPLGEEIPAQDRRSPEYFGKFVEGEIARWSGPIKASGVTVEWRCYSGLRMSPVAAAIAFENIFKRHGDSATPALDNVSLGIREGEFVAIVGPSGSGKSTLLRLVNRLIDPSAGTVRVHGEDVRTADAPALRRRIGYVFQGVGLFPHMTAAENIAITPRLLGWDRARIEARVNEMIDLVRLDRALHRERLPAQLSGGEGQRVGIARALAAGPKIVLMDEPFGALDPLTRDALGEDYRRLHDTLGLTTAMVTHDTLEAVLLADRIVVVRHGRIVADGTPRALMNEAQDGYVRELMAVPRRHAERLRALGGAGAP